MYFASNYGSQNTFVYQPTFDKLEFKKDKGTDHVLSWKSNEHIILNLSHHILISDIA